MPNIIKSPYPDTIPVTVTAQPSGTKATFTPNTVPFDKQALQNGFHIAEPQTAWTSGQWAQCGNGDHCRWQGSSWKSVGNGYQPDRMGGAPEVLPFDLVDIRARNCTGYGTWQVGDAFTPADGVKCYWTGNQWITGWSPTPTNLVANWLFHEGTGQAAWDYSQTAGGGQVWLGSTGNPDADDPNWTGYGVEVLSETGDFLGGTSADSWWTGSISLLMVVHFYTAGQYQLMITKGVGTNLNTPFEFLTGNEAGAVRLWFVRGNASGYYHWLGPTVPVGQWAVIGFMCYGSAMSNVPTFYVNKTATAATLSGNTTTGNVSGGATPYIYIGRRADAVASFRGQMGLIWAWNTNHSPAIMNANYDAIKLIMDRRAGQVILP